MHPISQEAQAELFDALKSKMKRTISTLPILTEEFNNGILEAMTVVASFPTSDWCDKCAEYKEKAWMYDWLNK